MFRIRLAITRITISAKYGVSWTRNQNRDVLTGSNHFAHREADDVVVDLFWDRNQLEDEFRVEVGDRCAGTRFVLHPLTGEEAMEAFYPFAAAEVPFDREACAA